MFPAGGNGSNQHKKEQTYTTPRLADLDITFNESANARKAARNPEIRETVIREIEERGDVITPNKVAKQIEGGKNNIKQLIVESNAPKNTNVTDTKLAQTFNTNRTYVN